MEINIRSLYGNALGIQEIIDLADIFARNIDKGDIILMDSIEDLKRLELANESNLSKNFSISFSDFLIWDFLFL